MADLCVKNIRKVSFNILYEVFFNKKLLNDVINDSFKNDALDDTNKAFVKRECTGVIENIEYIDSIINKFSKIKSNKLDKNIIVILRLGIYEIKYMDSVPSYATINECVELVKKSKNNRLAPFVNAVLRSVDRCEIKIVDEKTKHCYFRTYNNGDNIVLNELDNKNIDYKNYDGALTFESVKVYATSNYKEIIDLNSFKDGYILIEDASSIHLVDKLSECIRKHIPINAKKVKILDTCSSPGGKILSLIDILKSSNIKYEALARDISESKIKKIEDNINRLKAENIKVEIKDATLYDKDDIDKYDLVILDVPCTGLGVIDKKPDIKLNYSDDKKFSLVKIQKNILNVSKDYVKIGGLLSYSTCTEAKEENEDNILEFLSNNKNFEKIYEKRIARNDENKCDGFYMCIMKKTS